MIGQENLKLTTDIAAKLKYGYDRNSFGDAFKNRKVEIKKSIRAKGHNSKICVWLFCMTMLLNISTIKCMSDQSSESNSTTPAPSTGGEYFTSIVRMKELARLEQSVIAEMSTVLENFGTTVESTSPETIWEEGLLKMKLYIHDYDSSIRSMVSDTVDVETAVISHPLMSYRMLRRVVFDLPEIFHFNVEGRLEKLTNITALIKPVVTEDDVVGAMQGIIRLQNAYKIFPYDFAQGRLLTFDTKSGLTEMDCFRIGNLALNENKQSSIAIEWLLQALRMCLQVEGYSGLNMVEMVRHSLRNAIDVHNNDLKDKKPWTFGKAIQTSLSEMTRDNEKELIRTLHPHPSLPPYQLFITENTKFDGINFYGLCRGDKLRNETLTKNLKCYYKTDTPFLAIKPLKVEVHSQDPLILQFYDVLPDLIIKQFTNTTSHRLKRALVGRKDRKRSMGRIACNAFIDDKDDEILSMVPKIIHESTVLNLIPAGSSEPSQVSTYGAIGGYYGHHYDTIYTSPDSQFPKLDDGITNIRERIATVMFYLSDLKLGGGTAFPRIGVYAEPIKGSAIFWYNLKKNGQRHDYTMHGGCPVLLGEKWVVNKWIRSGDQMFVRKCSLDSNL